MEIDFDGCHLLIDDRGSWLCLHTPQDRLVKRICDAIEKDKIYTAKISKKRKKRSLDSNAYFWTLCDKLAEKTGISKSEIYRQEIQDIGGNCEILSIKKEEAEKFCHLWESHGIGWVAKPLSEVCGLINVIAYQGSSTYDTAQMSRLIDTIVQDCKAQGIETLPPDKLEEMKSRWNP